MDTGEWFERVAPFNLISKWFQYLRLPLSQNRKRLDYSVAQSFEEFGRAFLRSLENVARELAIMCALFNNNKIVGFTELLPDLRELCQHQLPKEGADADVSEIIAFSANRAAAGGIVSVLGMVKDLVHEPVEWLWSAIPNLGSDKLDQSGVSRLRPQRPTLNSETFASKRSTLNTQYSTAMAPGG
jgi:hypothetical protein